MEISNIKKELLNDNITNFSIEDYRVFFNDSIRQGKRFYVCLIDIERFRYYNYIHGYKYGDAIFDKFYKFISSKIYKNDYIYKFNGDRIVLFKCINEEKEDEKNIKEIFELIEGPIHINDIEAKINFKIGVTKYLDNSKGLNTILKYSEIALNYAKRISKRKYEFFKHFMYEDILKNEEFISQLENAFKNKEFTLYYQPQINTKTMKVYGIEALLRWNSPKLGIVSPIHFIDILEGNRMIKDVGKFVFKESCYVLKMWEDLGYKDLSISINMSEIQFEDKTLLNFIEETIEEIKIDPKQINIEITERFLMGNTKDILRTLTELRGKGMKIFIDDFGVKYSSLNYLFNLPIDGIKIDKSFVDRIHYSKKEFIIVKNIINLANEMGLEVVAEGVEEIEQLECLSTVNCHKIQGYFFGKPVNSEKVLCYFNKFS
ncbi:GGDEF domain-containing phosphodiesterase [Clostridium sp.]|uniref:putative bifunctional diguanylate cyclase/phosphodiesterase n=1 Tax=Clostridium sp. TaxID=1506 RepID=UPI0025860102|nr:GGDEF domain-containing phosphodiesterase [Clostridium sp.]MDF2502657.1 putative sensory transduction protein with and domain [Clostridium sp.]